MSKVSPKKKKRFEIKRDDNKDILKRTSNASSIINAIMGMMKKGKF